MEAFYLEDYISGRKQEKSTGMSFEKLCDIIKEDFIREWDSYSEDVSAALELQKKAIIGYSNEVAFFKEKIKAKLEEYNLDASMIPPWYQSTVEGIYHENWGLAGIAEWFTDSFKQSSSAKIIGERIYFMQDGSMRLMPQKIKKHRREQLIRAFLLLTPGERLDKSFHEIYLLDGTRVTVFSGHMTKKGQDVIIFRRYLIPNYTFEEQAKRGTIPAEAIPLFKAMVDMGPNLVVAGQVRSAKTTFLSTWQSYEDPRLEGVMVETDPEIPLHLMIPEAPVIQLIADNDDLRKISKNLLRSDADYFILAEARDGNALETAIRIAAKGTRRIKLTFHCSNPIDFPYDAAWEIVKATGGDLSITAKRVAASFDYIFHFVQLSNKNKKKLKSIYEISFNREADRIEMERICAYDYEADNWQWKFHIGNAKDAFAKEQDPNAFKRFADQLALLALANPLDDKKEGSEL